MAEPATVRNLLGSLDYGKSTAERDILEGLRQHFAVIPDADLERALDAEPASRVLAAILELLRPFAYMILDVYGFLADAAVRTEGNLEVHVPLDEAQELNLNLKYFRQFEQPLISSVTALAFDPTLLPKEGNWRIFHDEFWPPDCASFESRGERRCSFCPPETLAGDFSRFVRYFDELDRLAEEQLRLPPESQTASPTTFDWKSIRDRWSDCKKRRPHDLNTCSMEREWVRDFFTGALKEFDAAHRSVSVGDIRRFLALPYWKQRWQLYEVWFVTLLLRSYGLANLELKTDGSDWTLAVGKVSAKPIAIGNLADGDNVEFYYQYQGVPPSPLFKNCVDRPEVLVRRAQTGKVLLVSEVKARTHFGTQDMKGALFALEEWNADAIVGLNYFDMGSGVSLSTLRRNGTEIVAADECTPRSAVAKELSEWLANFWARTLGDFISVLLIDTSGSMPGHLIPSAIKHVRRKIMRDGASNLLLATFSDAVRFYPSGALDEGSVETQPSGGTALSRAVAECRSALATRFPAAGQVSVHVVTDLDVEREEIRDLIEWARSKSTVLRVYTWANGEVERLAEAEPELKRVVELLGT
jgi:hypothetical protein